MGWLLPTLLLTGLSSVADAEAQAVVPLDLEDLHMILEPVTEGGRSLRMQLATGQITHLHPAGVRSLGLGGAVEGGVVSFPAFRPGDGIPDLAPSLAETPRVPVEEPPGPLSEVDGILGHDWLQGRTLTLDYPGRALLLREPGDLPLHGPGERVELIAPPEGASGAPQVRVTLAGESMVAVIETAAGAELTPEGVASLGDLRPPKRAITRMEARTFDAVRQRNPGWRVVEHAEAGSGEPLLEVRGLVVASVELPTLWVLRTPAAPGGPEAEGSRSLPAALLLGGDVLREFRLTLDFVGGVAVFEPAGFP